MKWLCAITGRPPTLARIMAFAAAASLLAAAGCLPPPAAPPAYPTFTPLDGFQVLGLPTVTALPGSTPTGTPAGDPDPGPTPSLTPVPPSPTPAPTAEPVEPTITLVFTGQIVPARCVQAETDRLGQADYIYEEVAELLSPADLTIGALNAALSDYPPTTGCVETFVLVGRSIQADAMAAAGFDIMSVATNHIKNCGLSNCGDRAFVDTLDNLRRVGIETVGAGLDLEQAIAPIVVEISGIRFGFVSLGQIEPLAFAGPDTPGIGVLNEDNLRAAVAEARQLADVIIVLPHWGPEYTHYPNLSQIALAQIAVEAGADLIVGNHTHYIQAYGMLEGVPVYFGLGNFVFDQTQEPERQQSLVLRITFQGTRIVSSEIVPVVNDSTGRVRIADQDEATLIFTLLNDVNADVQADLP